MHDPTFEIPEPKPEEIYPPCPDCDGSGLAIKVGSNPNRWREEMGYVVLCKTCNGLGYIVPEEDEGIPY